MTITFLQFFSYFSLRIFLIFAFFDSFCFDFSDGYLAIVFVDMHGGLKLMLLDALASEQIVPLASRGRRGPK